MITNDLFCIAIPTVNQANLLNPNLINYTSTLFPGTWILIVENGKQDIYKHENITALKQEKNQMVSRSWNILCDNAFLNYPYIWLVNDDVDLGQNEHQIITFLKENPSVDFFNSYYEFCSFILPKTTYEKIGSFDEEISCYFSDDDYRYRMKKQDCNILMTNTLNPSTFRRSMSIQKDPMLNLRFELDRQAYLKKHGGGVGSEMY